MMSRREPNHVGLKAHPINYITPPIMAASGTKYDRFFVVLFYPKRADELPPCVVIGSEERHKHDPSISFISGAKFYPQHIDRLQKVWEDVLLTEIAFRSFVNKGLAPDRILLARLRDLYHNSEIRFDLTKRLRTIYQNMLRCSKLSGTESEDEEER